MIEVLKQALTDAKRNERHNNVAETRYWLNQYKLIAEQAIAQLESQEPVAWLLTEKNINSLQVDSIQLLIDRLKHAHHTDLCVRINGQDEWFQADWLKHMVRATPPQRTWQGLTDEDKKQMAKEANYHWEMTAGEYAERIGQLTEAKLKEKNSA